MFSKLIFVIAHLIEEDIVDQVAPLEVDLIAHVAKILQFLHILLVHLTEVSQILDSLANPRLSQVLHPHIGLVQFYEYSSQLRKLTFQSCETVIFCGLSTIYGTRILPL